MRTTDERMQRILGKKTEMRKKEQKRSLTGFGAASVLLFGLLLSCICLAEKRLHPAMNTQLAGSSMLSENAGGYVLVAVLAFAAAVVITVLCMNWKRKNNGRSGEQTSGRPERREKKQPESETTEKQETL